MGTNNLNPLANDSIIGKILNKKNKKDEIIKSGVITPYLLGMNNSVQICAEACACCWDKKIPDGYQNIAEYVAKRSKIGHTSVIEHSNFVIYMSIDKCYEEDLVDFLTWIHYLSIKNIKVTGSDKIHIIIGGSLRGFADIYRESDDLNNSVLKSVTGLLYQYAHSSMFEDICALGLLNKESFANIEYNKDDFYALCKYDYSSDGNDTHELFNVVGLDSVHTLFNNLYDIDKDVASSITTYDLLRFVTVSIMFKNMSRTCTHQLVRHRNAITQESQRYVNYTNASFSSPEMFKPEKYDTNHKYTIRFGSSAPMHLTLSEIGAAEIELYNMLANPVIAGNDYALLKEDARAFLPGNVQCRKIYITFTYKNLLKFLNLREDRAAQAEIRLYATAVGEWFRSKTEFNTKELCDLYTKPRLLIEDPFKIDIDQGIIEESFPTEEDYINAAGLADNKGE